MNGYPNVPISHHTGAQLIAFPLQIIEFTKWTRQASAVQSMNMQVPTFHDSRCHQRGTIEMMIPIPENTVNAVFKAVIPSRLVS